jgi:hypothetical protein
VPGLTSPPTPEQIEGDIKGTLSVTEEARSRPNATVLDNTSLTQDQTATAVDRWILERLDGGACERYDGQQA